MFGTSNSARPLQCGTIPAVCSCLSLKMFCVEQTCEGVGAMMKVMELRNFRAVAGAERATGSRVGE